MMIPQNSRRASEQMPRLIPKRDRRTTASHNPAPHAHQPEPANDFELVRRHGTNVLLLGPDGWCARVIQMMRAELAEPVVSRSREDDLVLPPSQMVGTLILYGVDGLSAKDQQQLLDWLSGAPAVRVISTTAAPLVARVELGAFIELLYYRLNTVCIFTTGCERDVTTDRPEPVVRGG